jgi:hypothetical protein
VVKSNAFLRPRAAPGEQLSFSVFILLRASFLFRGSSSLAIVSESEAIRAKEALV